MAIIKEVYSSTRVNLIYQLLRNEADNGTPKEYDVRVDELKVVSRTSDPERFHGHEEFVLPETRSIIINIYDGTSNRCNRYNLLLREEDPSQQELSGIEKSINTKMLQERKKWEFDKLKEDYDDLKEQLGEAEEYAEQLKGKIEQLEAEKSTKSNKITETIVGLAGMFLASKPNALSGIPLIGDLLGGNKTIPLPVEETSGATVQEGDGTATFQKMVTPKAFTGDITEGDEQSLKDALSPFFKPEYIDRVVQIIQYLFMHNSFVDQTITVMEHAIKQGDQTKKAA
jgi:uncharacterized phage infection (PIP) family protein YhgE